ncbi:MAG: helix-turn-helix transcriptional regulator [Phaeodactylibacter sp.]|nr:helix-turn-helix transcriptional regulator [Phaeodactylibacter sp.]
MEIVHLNIWALLILLGAAHGFFLALVLGSRKENQPANWIFALLLLSVALHLAEYTISISGLIFQFPHFMFSTYPLLFVIGPLFYLYVLAYLGGNIGWNWRTLRHFIPAFFLLLLLLPFYVKSGADKAAFFLAVSENGFRNAPPEQFILMLFQALQMLAYLYASYRLIGRKQLSLAHLSANGNILKVQWLRRATLVFLAFTVFFALATTVLILTGHYRIEIDYMVLLSLAGLTYVAGYVALAQPALFHQPIRLSRATRVLSDAAAGGLKETLVRYMETQEPFLDEGLKLDDVAAAISTPAHHISEVLSNELHTNFFDFVNGYRVEKAKALLRSPETREAKILAIAFDAGFGNKSTFNRVFKKFTGLTPGQYRQAWK